MFFRFFQNRKILEKTLNSHIPERVQTGMRRKARISIFKMVTRIK